jgi:hypothetical protein
MIKLNELRIGIFILHWDKIKKIQTYSELHWAATQWDTPEINPIPLTSELLDKCGFEWSIYHQERSKNDFAYVLTQFEDGYRFKIFRTDNYIGCKINYLHQLQDKFYQLSEPQTELEIKGLC